MMFMQAIRNTLRNNLKRAAIDGDLDRVTALLETSRTEQEIDAQSKGLALFHASQNEHLPVVEKLLERCNLDISLEYKQLAIKVADYKGYKAISEKILDFCGADTQIATQLKEKSTTEQTPLNNNHKKRKQDNIESNQDEAIKINKKLPKM